MINIQRRFSSSDTFFLFLNYITLFTEKGYVHCTVMVHGSIQRKFSRYTVRFNGRYAAIKELYVQNYVNSEFFLIARNVASASTSIMIGESIRLSMIIFFLQNSGRFPFFLTDIPK
jgi:hypothetical protein